MEEMKTLTIGGIKFDIVDDGAVRHVAQELTDEQKAQARENIGATTAEDWQLLLDTTTTEEISKFSIDHDMNWQPFSCRKIAAKIVMPSAFGSVVMIWYGVEGSEPCVAMFAQNSAKVIEFSMEVVKGCYHVLSYQQRESDFVGAGLNHEHIFDTRRLDREKYDFFGFFSGAAFPVGTRIIVWGCKA